MLNQRLRVITSLFLLVLPGLLNCASLPAEIKLMTYNVLNDHELSNARGQSVLSVLANAQADFLVLQEVDQSFLQTLKSDSRFAQYRVYSHQQASTIIGGLAILSKIALKTTRRYERLPSSMGRGLLFLMLESEDKFLCIANVHLESMMDDTAIRIKQLKLVFHHLRYCDDIVLSGDFNFGDDEAENRIFPAHYQDVWLKLRPDEKGLTYDRKRNELSDDNAFWFEKSRRLDRIYFSSECLSARSVALKGDTPEQKGVMPSDHFAVLATFSGVPNCKIQPD